MRAPWVSACVQVRPALGRGQWLAAIVTAVRPERQQLSRVGWVHAIDVAAFPTNGGIRPMRMVGLFRGDEEEQREEDVWRWAPESALDWEPDL
jgi:hypothetical protein